MLLGYVGSDPKINEYGDGQKSASFKLATSTFFKDKEGNTLKRTEWHRITAFRGAAKYAEGYVRKGNYVYVEGNLQYGQYTNKEGIEISTTDIIADKVKSQKSRKQMNQDHEGYKFGDDGKSELD